MTACQCADVVGNEGSVRYDDVSSTNKTSESAMGSGHVVRWRWLVSHEDHGAVAALRSTQQAQFDLWEHGSVQHDNPRIEFSCNAPRRRDNSEILGQCTASPACLA
jgi:hypothetical protein